MKVLMISTDRNVFMEGTEVRDRMIKYGRLAEELHIIVFSLRALGLTQQKISENVWIYPTNSLSRWLYIHNAISVGKKILSHSYQLKAKNWLVTAQDPFESGYVGYKIARRFKLELQLQVHTDFLDPHFIEESRLNKTRLKFAKFLIPKATGIRVVSKKIKYAIVEQFPDVAQSKISILPIFIDLQKIRSTDPAFNLKKKYPQFDFILLIVSRLEPEKNIPLALFALKQVLLRHPKTGLVIVGEGSEKVRLKKLVHHEGILDNVVFEGWQENIASYYKTADALLVTSNYEGFGRVFIEAAAVGCPIITTDVGIARELILDDESSFVCPVGDRACMARNIARLIEHESIRRVYALKLEARAQGVTISDEKIYLDRYKMLWENCLRSKQ
jgi:glycosyltransferase involved in cell wall biosynthesis